MVSVDTVEPSRIFALFDDSQVRRNEAMRAEENTSIIALSLPNLTKAGSFLFDANESIKRLFPKDFPNGICVFLEQKQESKNVPTQEIQEVAPSNGTFILTDLATVICGKKDGKNGHGK